MPMACRQLCVGEFISSFHGISQTRTLEWVAISFCKGYSQCRDQPAFPALAGRFFTTEPSWKPSQF